MPADSAVSATESSPLLGPTSITSENVEQAFREYLNDPSLTLVKADAKIIAAGQGFTSYILRVLLTWRDEDKTKHKSALPDSAILKALSKGALDKIMDGFKAENEDMKNSMMQLMAMTHTTECTAYEMLGKLKSPPVPIPRPYATWPGDKIKPPLILLEDLGDRATVLGDGTLSLDYAHLLKLVGALASLHAWCLTTEEKWSPKFQTIADRLQFFESFKPMMIQGVKKLKETHPDMFGRLDEEKFMKLFVPEEALRLNMSHRQWMPDVLIHGDFWANNAMFNKLPDGGMGEELVALIDWQMCLAGNPMTDLGRVLSMSADNEIRENRLEDLVKHYYDSLKAKLGDKMPKELTMDRVLEMAQEHTALNCIMMFTMHDMMIALFASADQPDAEARGQRLLKRAKDSVTYASKYFDILSD